jgi:hypothetical protein
MQKIGRDKGNWRNNIGSHAVKSTTKPNTVSVIT